LPGVSALLYARFVPPADLIHGCLQIAARHLSKEMSEHKMTLTWKRATPDFEYKTYNRNHTWSFDGGHEMQASSAPAYLGDPALVDPEEAFVAALSSCHMLTFLAAACKKKFLLDEYVDQAVGHMEKNAEGKLAITKVELHPKLKFSGEHQPSEEEIAQMHHFAHENCFIANSVKTEVTVAKS
jgi:organic hydroperoxide reductase OsmC/OhrA